MELVGDLIRRTDLVGRAQPARQGDPVILIEVNDRYADWREVALPGVSEVAESQPRRQVV